MEKSNIMGINLLGKIAREVHMLLFADDLVLVAPNASSLQKKINLLSNFTKENHLNPNLSKTKIIIFRRAGPISKKEKFSWWSENIEIVSSYKYLGVTFSSSGLFHAQKKEAVAKATGALGSIWKIINKGKMNIPDAKFRIYDTMIQPILLYASQIWALDHLDDIEIVQQTFLKILYKLPRHSPGYFTRLENHRSHNLTGTTTVMRR